MRVAIDVDGVLADHFTPFCRQYCEETGVPLRPSDLPTWDVTLPDTDADVLSLVDDRLESPAYLESLDPIPGAVESVRRLERDGHETVIATHRPAHTHEVTEAWLNEHGIPYSEYVYDVPANKGTLDVDALVDDYHGTVADALSEGVDAYLLLQPWNRQYAAEIPRTQIATSWREIRSAFAP